VTVYRNRTSACVVLLTKTTEESKQRHFYVVFTVVEDFYSLDFQSRKTSCKDQTADIFGGGKWQLVVVPFSGGKMNETCCA